MATNFNRTDPVFGLVDIDDDYITDDWLISQYTGKRIMGVGNNTYGQLADGTVTARTTAIQVTTSTNWVSFSNNNGVLAIKTDGTLWAWGDNTYGQLGNNTSRSYSSPVQIGALTNWNQISTSTAHAVAIKTDGTLWTWGWNGDGQLGNNTTTPYSSPIQIGSLTDWKKVYQAVNCTFAIKIDGTLWAWGRNVAGQLGIGNTANVYSSPVQVGSLNNWKQISNFGTHAIKTDGTLWAWGRNIDGQLGIFSNYGSNAYYSSPIQVGSLTDWKQVSGGSTCTLAVKNDGTLWAWGNNGGNGLQGALGLNISAISVVYTSPVQVGTMTNWKQVASNGSYSAAIKTDGTLWAWGYGSGGSAANWTGTGLTSSPVQIGSLNNWVSLDGAATLMASQQTDSF